MGHDGLKHIAIAVDKTKKERELHQTPKAELMDRKGKREDVIRFKDEIILKKDRDAKAADFQRGRSQRF